MVLQSRPYLQWPRSSGDQSEFFLDPNVGDRTSSDRLYQGALIVHREKDKPFVLRAQVKAKTWKWHQRLQYPRSKRFDSWPIQRPGSFLEFGEFIERENGIQKLVEDCNYALAPIGRLLPSRDTLFLLNPQ